MGKRHPGRPPLDAAGSTQFCVMLPDKTFDQLYARAQRDRASMADVLRRALAEKLSDKLVKPPK
jgi:hypothetical protein